MPSKKNAQLNPAAQSLDYQALKDDWELITDLLGYTDVFSFINPLPRGNGDGQ